MMVTNFALIVLLLWAGSVPVVIPKHHGHMNRKFWGQSVCNKYALPLNTMWTLRTSCEDTKRFQCQPGYQSRVQTTCRNGLWYTEPTCQVSAVTCPSGEIINNSDNVTKSGIFGEDFTYDCKAGYRSDNGMTGTMTCDKRGNWADKATCEGVRCPSGENITFSSDVTQSRTFGEELYYDCLDGYTSSSNNGTLTCGTNGDWAVKRPCEVCYQDKNETLDVRVIPYGSPFLFPLLFNQRLYEVKTVAECTELCNNASCSVHFAKAGKYCYLYMQPIIFLPSVAYNATACFDKCTELIECVTMIFFEQACVLANVNQSMLPAAIKFAFLPTVNGRTAEKICI